MPSSFAFWALNSSSVSNPWAFSAPRRSSCVIGSSGGAAGAGAAAGGGGGAYCCGGGAAWAAAASAWAYACAFLSACRRFTALRVAVAVPTTAAVRAIPRTRPGILASLGFLLERGKRLVDDGRRHPEVQGH